jgi:branched-chain amino acid transport system permease protein
VSPSRTLVSRADLAWRQLWPLVAPAALVSLIVLAEALLQSDVLTRIVIRALIYLVLVIGLYIFAGNSGILSFGHISFMAIGAYVGALLTIPQIQKEFLLPDLPGWLARAEVPFFVAAAIAGVVAGLVAAVVGIPLMRLDGIAAGIATFSFLIVVRVVISNWDSVTRGTGSMPGVPTDTTPFRALLCVLAALVGAYAFQRSRVGRRLRAAREDDRAAASVGIHIVRERTAAFALSAFFCGVAGVLFGHFVGIFSPDDFYLSTTFIVVAMLVVGGIGSLAGAVIGALTVSAVSEGLLQLEAGVNFRLFDVHAPAGLQETGLAVFLLLVLLLRPDGITGGREFSWPWPLVLRPPDVAAPQPVVAAAPSLQERPR